MGKLEPGRELDALVAEKVFHHRVEGRSVEVPLHPTTGRRMGPSSGMILSLEALPRYSTDIAAAWEIVERLKTTEAFLQGENLKLEWLGSGWLLHALRSEDYFSAEDFPGAPTAPLAICLAALKAVGAI
jgi:hypothetical protein